MLQRIRSFLSTSQGKLAAGAAGIAIVGALASLQRLWPLAAVLAFILVGSMAVIVADGDKKTARMLRLVRQTNHSIERLRQAVDATTTSLSSLAQATGAVSSRSDRLAGDLQALGGDVRGSQARVEAELEAVTAAMEDLDKTTRDGFKLTSERQQAARSAITEAVRLNASYALSEIDALLQVRSLLDVADRTGMIPLASGWAMSPTGLLTTVDLVTKEHPLLTVELGPGASTIYIAMALRATGPPGAKVVSLEHDPEFARVVSDALTAHDLTTWAEVRLAPLEPVDLGESEPFLWYDQEALADLQDVELLVVDGPPKGSGDLARFPALPLMAERLRAGALILLDDARRPAERDILDRWEQMFPVKRRFGAGREQAILEFDPEHELGSRSNAEPA